MKIQWVICSLFLGFISCASFSLGHFPKHTDNPLYNYGGNLAQLQNIHEINGYNGASDEEEDEYYQYGDTMRRTLDSLPTTKQLFEYAHKIIDKLNFLHLLNHDQDELNYPLWRLVEKFLHLLNHHKHHGKNVLNHDSRRTIDLLGSIKTKFVHRPPKKLAEKYDSLHLLNHHHDNKKYKADHILKKIIEEFNKLYLHHRDEEKVNSDDPLEKIRAEFNIMHKLKPHKHEGRDTSDEKSNGIGHIQYRPGHYNHYHED